MSQRIPASAGQEREKKRDHQFYSLGGHSLCTKELDFVGEEKDEILAETFSWLKTRLMRIDAFYLNLTFS